MSTPKRAANVSIVATCPRCTEEHLVHVQITPAVPAITANAVTSERMFTLRELEPILGLKNRRLRQLVYDGHLRATKYGAGRGSDRWRVRESDLRAFQQRRRQSDDRYQT